MKKKWYLLPILFSLIIPYARADVMESIKNIWQTFLEVGNLSFLGISDGNLVVGFTRILIWIMIFTVFFGVMVGLKEKVSPFKHFKRGQAAIIAGVMATIAAVFLPAEVLLATGAGWATAIALLLIGGPIVGIGFLLWYLPGKKWGIALKIVLCLLLLWILIAMKYHVSEVLLGGV